MCAIQALEAYDLRLFEAGRFSRPVAEGTDEVLDQAVKSLDRHGTLLQTGTAILLMLMWLRAKPVAVNVPIIASLLVAVRPLALVQRCPGHTTAALRCSGCIPQAARHSAGRRPVEGKGDPTCAQRCALS
jgi:hypothetical protein